MPEIAVSDVANRLTQRIKSTSDSNELLDIMTTTGKTGIEPQQLVLAFNRLFEHQKKMKKSKELLTHPGFENICHLLKFKAPRMESNGVLSCLKVLSSIGMKSDSVIVQRLLHLIKDQINDLSPNNLLFLNFLLTKMEKNPLIEALQIAIPLVFNLNISQKIDHENPRELSDLLYYISTSSIEVSAKSMMNIVTALTLHGHDLGLREAMSVIWSLTDTDTIDPANEKLFLNCMRVLNEHFMEMKFTDLETTLEKLVARAKAMESVFYNEEFFKNCVKFVIEKDCGFISSNYIQRKFNKIRFVSFDLLNYMDQAVVKNHAHLSSCKIACLLTFVDGFSTANYKSENWEIMKSLLHENPLLSSKRTDLPWMRFTLELLALDFHSDILLGKIFKPELTERYLSNDKPRFIDYSQLILLWQAVTLLKYNYNGPKLDQKFIDDATISNATKPNETCLNFLANMFGGRNFIQTNVTSSHGHCLDFVISFDNSGNPIEMPCRIKKYDELPKSQVKHVAVFFYGQTFYTLNYPQRLRGIFDLRKRTIEALGIKAVYISTKLWNNLPESERNDYLEREIRYFLK